MTLVLRRALLPALLVLLSRPLTPQTPDEQARRLLEDGRAYWAKGQLKQALDSFNTIVTGFPNTDSVDDALLEIGRYHVEVEGNADKGRETFEQVTKRFPQSDGAPGAYYQLGLLTMNRAGSAAELDDALAQFTRVQRLYPKSEWVPRSLYASGLVHRKAGRLQDAVEAARRVSLEYPTSDAAPAAQFQIGQCLALAGDVRLAMEEFQQVRNRFPDSEWAGRALERTTALYRLFGSGKPAFQLDPSYRVGSGDILRDVRALLLDPASGTLWIASEKVKAAVPFDASGKIGSSLAAENPRGLTLSPRGELLVAAKLAVRVGPRDIKTFAIPGEHAGEPKMLEDVTSAVITHGGSLLVADEGRKRVYRYDLQYRYQGSFPDAKEREISRMLVDGEGAILLLDKDEKTVRVFDEAGHAMRSLGPRGSGFEFRKPVDVAADPFRNSYVADAEGPIYVFSPQGQLLTTLTADEMRRPAALALDPSGAVLVYDEKLERILRFK